MSAKSPCKFTNSKIKEIERCIFTWEMFSQISYDLLTQKNCENYIISFWQEINCRLSDAVTKKDSFYYQKIEKIIFDFLKNHSKEYFEYSGGLMHTCINPLSDKLQKITCKTISELYKSDQANLLFMIDTIANPEDRYDFTFWLIEQMADKNIPRSIWGISKSDSGISNIKCDYHEYFAGCIIKKLHEIEAALSEEYDRLTSTEYDYLDKYADNIELFRYIKFIKKYTKLLNRVQKYEKGNPASSLKTFISEAISKVYVGSENTCTFNVGDSMFSSTEDTVINKYVIIYDVLMKHETPKGLKMMCEAFQLEEKATFFNGCEFAVKNYHTDSEIVAQLQKESEFFLKHLLNKLVTEQISKNQFSLSIRLAETILSNPSLDLIHDDATEDSEIVTNCILSIKAFIDQDVHVLDFMMFELYDEYYSVLSILYFSAVDNKCIAEENHDNEYSDYADFISMVAEDYEHTLQLLKDRIVYT